VDKTLYIELTSKLKSHLKIKRLKTPVRAPKANAFCERVIGSLRRECLDHMIIFTQNHLRKVVKEYIKYYNQFRPHQGIKHQIPNNKKKKSVKNPNIRTTCKVNELFVLNGLHHHYYKITA